MTDSARPATRIPSDDGGFPAGETDGPLMLRLRGAGRAFGRRLWRQLPSSPDGMLALAKMPAWTPTRPRDSPGINPVHRLLTTTLARSLSSGPRLPTIAVWGD